MRIGVAKEIKPDEYRIALTPAGALELINHGHEVAIEQGAGTGSAFPDEAFMVAELTPGALRGRRGVVVYGGEFR